ncbi:hypothetical protein GC330_00380 [Yersinia pestis]|uniref:hypothetical protein n=1 Tax=Yersinia pestis TaxID=632 RepID=UPI0001D04403|nr:hypothetical protein [Yersinia pestis]ADE63239.1 hypothetical protein YPZ3_0329 [Yersinia pestis Z176003]MBE7735580.1 hypothetical protein [Yersinia pestis]MBE7739359.1 hypothetical protein [Yersinia pestis]MBE7743808.1 hypothetical protein [Yersinia pestis]MBE7751326.1 hypothetical protein [Yersinia pestis]
MSVFTFSVVPEFFSILQRVKSAVQRIPLHTDWFVNASGNFAVRAHVICSNDGSVSALLTLRKGWYKGEYTYASTHVVLSCKHTERRKAYRLASQHAEHLARLRYRF